MAILISESRHKTKKIPVIEVEHYIMIKRSIYQEDIAILNMYAPNNRMAKYMIKKLIKRK